jgi:hypothetical protein
MATHTCTSCGHSFTINSRVRMPDRLFTIEGLRHSATERARRYFLVTCPKCLTVEDAQEIRVLGVFGPRTAIWGPAAVFALIVLMIVISERMGF